MTQGLFLLNLGTPDRADYSSVGRYLFEFLSDYRVIDLPVPLRYFLLLGVILPFRLRQSTHAYQAIWTNNGSPLLDHSKNLLTRISAQLGSDYKVALGMRYGYPGIEDALEILDNCQHITILPLFPQYSSAVTGSAIEKCLNLIKKMQCIPSLKIISDFYNHPAYIDAQASMIKPYLDTFDHILFSYHGLPERQLLKGACSSLCVGECRPIDQENQHCYRAQCFETTVRLAKALYLNHDKYSLSFQSRLGRIPWIRPYTDEVLKELGKKGIKRLGIVCPSFVADCLETLEEIGIRARKQWQRSGGKELTLIPCLNDQDIWVNAIQSIAKLSSSS